MKTTTRHAALGAATALVPSKGQAASLRSVAAFARGVDVDAEAGVIKNAAVMTVGPWGGHRVTDGEYEGQFIYGDETTIQQVADLINAAGATGVKVRFKHPELKEDPISGGVVIEDDLGTDVGYIRNARVVGDACRADIHLADYAAKLPVYGDVRSYLLSKAQNDPAGFGLSTEIYFDPELVTDGAGTPLRVVARATDVTAVDFVGKPAANPNGLLSSPVPVSSARADLCLGAYPSPSGPSMNDLFKRILFELGLPYDCSDEAAQAFFDALTDQMKEEIQTRIKAIAAATNVDLERAAKEAAGKVAQMSTKAIASAARAALATKTSKNAPPAKTAVAHLTSKGTPMNEKLKQYLQANHQLAADASDEDAQQVFDGLSADDQAKANAAASLSANAPAANATHLRNQVVTDEGDRLLAAEGKRVAQLQQLGTLLRVPAEVVAKAISDNMNVIDGKAAFLKHLSDTATPVAGSIRVGADANAVSMRGALSDAIRLRAGCRIEKPHDRASQLRGLPLIDMGRQYLSAHGVSEAFAMTQVDVWKALFAPRSYMGDNSYRFAQLAQSSDSFTNITLDAANKSLRQAYLDGQATWTAWARRATAPDFKNINRIALSDSPGLVSRSEGGPISYVTMADSKETYVLTEYTGGIRLTRQAIINDDLDAFGRIPQLQGAAARRKEDDVCYTVITANAAMADTGLLFNATAVTTAGGHANYTSSGTAISVTSLGVGRKTMRVQTGPKGAYLNLMPRFLLVPAALEALADQYTSSQFVPALSSSVNPFMQGGKTPLTPIIEPRLDANSATAWYLAASNDQIDTIEVCFLQDEPEPVLKQEVDFDTDDVKFAVRHTVAAKAIDFRGLYKNAGA